MNHPLSPVGRRAAIALGLIAAVLLVGTLGTKALTGWSWIDSFYFMSMVATAQGPPNAPPTFWAKIFISIMAFISIGTLIGATGTIFGPFLGYVFHKGVAYAQKEIELEEEKRRTEKKDEGN